MNGFSEYGLAALSMGVFAAFAVTALPWLVKRLEIVDGVRSPEFDGVADLDADDILLLIPIALSAGLAKGVLLVVAFGVTTFVCAFNVTHYKKLLT